VAAVAPAAADDDDDEVGGDDAALVAEGADSPVLDGSREVELWSSTSTTPRLPVAEATCRAVMPRMLMDRVW